mgnify:CR=1 FL=1
MGAGAGARSISGTAWRMGGSSMFWSCERGRVGSVERAAARWAGVGEEACMVIVVAMGVVWW